MAGRNFVTRIIDVGFCLVAAPIAVPLCLIAMVLIRWDSPGPALFAQQRVGRHGRTFNMFKLRTMLANTGAVPSHQVGAAQITRIGRILRKLKLDELPQLVNVLNGSMALVGPRPCLPTQTELIKERRVRGVLDYVPGITGPAQMQGIDMSEPTRLAEVDAAYFSRSTPGSDLRLLIGTALGAGRGDAALKGTAGVAPPKASRRGPD